MFCSSPSAAAKAYEKTVILEMVAYVLIMLGVTSYVHRHHPQGPMLYVLAAMPSVPIVAVLVAVGVYLQRERDEYQRDLLVRCMLWGLAAVLAETAFFSFLRSFGWTGVTPPFTEFITFWALMAVAKFYYKFRDRVPADE